MRGAAERGAAAAGTGAAVYVSALLQNLALSTGDNEEVCYCLKAWHGLPDYVKQGGRPNKDDVLKVRHLWSSGALSLGHSCVKHPAAWPAVAGSPMARTSHMTISLPRP